MMFFRFKEKTERQVAEFGEWWVIAAAGAGLIAVGLLIAIFPAILVALIAGCFVTAGMYVMSLGLAIRPREINGSANGRRVEIHVPRGDKRFSSTFESRW